ncbi:MAG: ATP-binding protein [Pedobacter sp.]
MLLTNENDLYNMMLHAPIGICILDSDTLRAETVNSKFLELAGKPYDAVYGKGYWDTFPEARLQYEEALSGVIESGHPYYSDEVDFSLTMNGKQEWAVVTFVFSPVKDKEGQVSKVAIWLLENTAQVKQRQQLEGLNEQLETTNQELRSSNELQGNLVENLSFAKRQLQIERDRLNRFFMQVPAGICVLEGPTHIYTLVNPEYQKLFPGRQLSGLPVAEALPEIKGTPIEDTLNGVYNTGETYEANSLLVPLAYIQEGLVEDRYFNFVYQARVNADNQVDGILVLVFEVTEEAVANKKIEALNSELNLRNLEFADTNQELTTRNQELNLVQQQLERINLALLESHERFRNIIHSSPTAILVTRGANMVFEEINASMLQMLGKDPSVKGKPWSKVVPELEGQHIIKKLYYTYRSGKGNKISAAPIKILLDGTPQLGYYDITYTALIEDGIIIGVMLFVVDVTEYITSKDELARAYEQVRLSKEAAELGTFDMNMETGYMEWDLRCRQLFGINHENEVSFEDDFLANLHPDDTQHVKSVLDDVFDKSVNNGAYDIEYRTVGVEDEKLRWVRAKGQVYFKTDNKPLRFIGSVLDITEQKQDEQRKNDFISMASHELKTPLTSLNAYLYILQNKAQKAEDGFLLNTLKKSANQVKKMITMVNGFLNVSRLESGKIQIDKQSFNMADLVKEVEEDSIATVTSHKVIFAPVLETVVVADKDKIGQVINNFISNAVKYSPVGSTINIACVTNDGNAQISVKDEGMGIEVEDQHKLFDRYFRVERNAANIAGFGIGLYLCAEIIQRHNGKIWVESEPGEGSTFYFSVPLD